MRLKRSRFILILITIAIAFWIILYFKFLTVYTNHKRLRAKQSILPQDSYPFDSDKLSLHEDGLDTIATGHFLIFFLILIV